MRASSPPKEVTQHPSLGHVAPFTRSALERGRHNNSRGSSQYPSDARACDMLMNEPFAPHVAIASGALSGWSSRLQISPASSRIFESRPLISDSSVCKSGVTLSYSSTNESDSQTSCAG